MRIRSTIALVAVVASGWLSAAPPDARVALVDKLYRDYAWEAAPTGSSRRPTFVLEPEAVLRQYLAPSLVNLILKDRECAEREQGICSLSFSPMWDSQDPAVKDLRVGLGVKPNEVVVRFVYPYGNKRVQILYDLVQVGSEWRIANIRTSDWSLASILESSP